MKKMTLFTLSLGLITASASAFAVEEIPTYHELEVTSVRLVPVNGGINPHFMAMEVYASVRFSNDCMVSERMVKEVDYSDAGTSVSYRVLGNGGDQFCPAVFQPVTREVLVDTYRGMDIMPIISVNKIRGQREFVRD